MQHITFSRGDEGVGLQAVVRYHLDTSTSNHSDYLIGTFLASRSSSEGQFQQTNQELRGNPDLMIFSFNGDGDAAMGLALTARSHTPRTSSSRRFLSCDP